MATTQEEFERELAELLEGMIGSDFDALYSKGRREFIVLPFRTDVLLLQGDGAVDFLQRMSTNDLGNLPEGRWKTTVLTNEKGRIVDLVTVARCASGIILLASCERGEAVKGWLEKYIIMENITIHDLTTSFIGCQLVGPKVATMVSNTEFKTGGIMGAESDACGEIGNHVLIHSGSGPKGAHLRLLLTRKDLKGSLTASLGHFSDNASIRTPYGELLEVFRIESGQGIYGVDFTSLNNPLESGFGDYISFSKGCYIGQEVIARLDSYKKLQKNFVGYVFPGPRTRVMAKGEIWSDERKVGNTTSHCWSPTLGSEIALGYISADTAAISVQFQQPGSDFRNAEVVRLPFV